MLLVAIHLFLATNCHLDIPNYAKADRFYTAVAKGPTFSMLRQRPANPKAHVDVFVRPSASWKTAQLRWESVEGPGSRTGPMVFEPGQACPRGDLPFREDGYEEPGFIVVERSANWVHIRLDQGTGWIRLSSKDEVVEYDDIVLNRQAELTAAWDGRVYSRPGGRSRRMEPMVWSQTKGRLAERPVTVTDSRRVQGVLWFQVRVLADSPCNVRDPKVLATGWIRGYSSKRQPTVEHFPRGC
jgi:hypothetical protein